MGISVRPEMLGLDFGRTGAEDDPLQRQRRIGAILGQIGGSAAPTPAPGSPSPVRAAMGRFWTGVKSGLDDAGRQWQRLGVATGAISEEEARRGGAYTPSPQPSAAPSIPEQLGHMAGRLTSPIDLATGVGATAVARRAFPTLAARAGASLLGQAAEGAVVGAIQNPVATVAENQFMHGRATDPREIVASAAMGAGAGAVLDPAFHVAGRAAVGAYRGTKAAMFGGAPEPGIAPASGLGDHWQRIAEGAQRFWEGVRQGAGQSREFRDLSKLAPAGYQGPEPEVVRLWTEGRVDELGEHYVRRYGTGAYNAMNLDERAMRAAGFEGGLDLFGAVQSSVMDTRKRLAGFADPQDARRMDPVTRAERVIEAKGMGLMQDPEFAYQGGRPPDQGAFLDVIDQERSRLIDEAEARRREARPWDYPTKELDFSDGFDDGFDARDAEVQGRFSDDNFDGETEAPRPPDNTPVDYTEPKVVRPTGYQLNEGLPFDWDRTRQAAKRFWGGFTKRAERIERIPEYERNEVDTEELRAARAVRSFDFDEPFRTATAPSGMRLNSGLPLDEVAREGAKLLDSGVRRFKDWRAKMEESGHSFASDQEARSVFKQGKGFLAALYATETVNPHTIDLDPTGRHFVAALTEKHAELREDLKEPAALKRLLIEEAADQVGYGAEALDIERAQKLSGNEIRGRLLAIERRTQDITELLEEREGAGVSEARRQEIDHLVAAMEGQLDGIARDFVVGRSQKGRDLAALKRLGAVSDNPYVWRAKAKQRLGGDEFFTSEHDTKIRELLNEGKTDELAGYVDQLKVPSRTRQLVGLFKALITPPGTLDVANAGSNTAMQGMDTLSQTFASGYDAVLSLLTGTKRTTANPFGSGSGEAWRHAFREGLREARAVMTKGHGELSGGKFGGGGNEPFTLFGSEKANDFVTRYLHVHWRRFGAADGFFKELQYWQTLYANVRLKAINEGLHGEARDRRIGEIFRELDRYPEVTVRAAEQAAYVTFTAKNKLAEAVRLGKAKLPEGGQALAEVAVPFVNTLANVADVTVDYTPAVGLIREVIRQAGKGLDRRAFVEALGRQTTGGMIVAAGYWLAKEGLATGSASRSQAEREHEEAEGRQPYAVKVGQHWRNLERIAGPASVLLGLGADLYEFDQRRRVYEPGRTTKDKALEAVRGYVGATVESAPGGSLSVFGKRQTEQPEADFVGSVGANLLAPNILGAGNIASGLDPVDRRVRSMTDMAKARVPGLRETLPARVSATGDTVRREGGLARAFLDPTRPTRANDEPVLAEMRRLRLWMSRPSKIDRYSPAQQAARYRAGETANRLPESYERSESSRDLIASEAGPRVIARVRTLMSRDYYQRLPDQQKRALVQRILNAEKQRADRRQAGSSVRRGAVPPTFPEE